MSMRREEDKIGRAPAATPGAPQYGPGPRRREISFRPLAVAVGSPGMNIVMKMIYAKHDGKPVDMVPVGESFDIIAEFTAEWPEGNVSLLNPWTVVFTAVCEQDSSIRAYGKTKFASSPRSDVMVLDDPSSIRMPDFNCTFRIKGWGHPDYEPLSLPPENQW